MRLPAKDETPLACLVGGIREHLGYEDHCMPSCYYTLWLLLHFD